jgi:hypothetical protein
MVNFDIFYDHSVDVVAIRLISWQFGIFCGRLTYYPQFGIFNLEKSGNPAPRYGILFLSDKLAPLGLKFHLNAEKLLPPSIWFIQ